MAAYILRRLWHMLPTLAGVVLLVFFLFKGFGGDPAVILAGLRASPEQIQAIRQQLGLDQPVWVQLGIFVGQILRFDWGHSWATHESVASLFASRLPATLTVMVPILVLEVLLAIPLALAVAAVRGSLTDRAVMVISTLAMSVSFLVYVIVGQYLFAFRWGLAPVQGWSDSTLTNLLTYVPLPALLAVAVSLAPQTRLYRSSFLIETFFSIPGLGREVLLAVNRSDYPVIQAATIYLAVITMLANLLTDVLYVWADPRVVLK
jgi:peptide/nickel transport system permease protein